MGEADGKRGERGHEIGLSHFLSDPLCSNLIGLERRERPNWPLSEASKADFDKFLTFDSMKFNAEEYETLKPDTSGVSGGAGASILPPSSPLQV